jgi:hypothetical protein
MQGLNPADIGTLVFFARQRELAAFRQARIRTDGFLIRDLQHEIHRQMALKEHISLDRMSLIIGFALRSSSVRSAHFLYRIPGKFRYLIRPHKAIGDAARMFLVDQEFHHFTRETTQGVKDHRAQYEQARQVRNAVKNDKKGENPGFRP